MLRRERALVATFISFALFLVLVVSHDSIKGEKRVELADRVVFSAPVQVLLAAGDSFLAANVETIRAMATADLSLDAAATASFQIRIHRVVAQLNPCHEDNYYVANAMLSWGGAPSEGLDVLRRATECRFWDEFPPFFYGFNQWFFNRNGDEARHALEMAASRSALNSASFRRIGIMIEAGSYSDDRAALAFLNRERDRSADEKLRTMLSKRIGRLQGLIVLREAQSRYEVETGRMLVNPRLLVDDGYLHDFPQDPLRLGYEFEGGRFRMREYEIPGVERSR